MGNLVDFPRIAVFRKGFWNEQQYGPDFPAQLAKSYEYFAAPDPQTGEPFYVPYVSVNHDQYPHLAGFQFGNLEAVHMDNDGMLSLDANEVPEEIGSLVTGKQLRKPSLEFATPIRDASGNLVGGMRGPNGKIYDGPVIKCLTFLGSEVPGVKGLPDIPEPIPTRKLSEGKIQKFADSSLKLSRFGESTMDRQAMIAALTAAGVDCTTLTDAVPDEFIAAILATVQKGNAAALPDPALQQMAQVAGAGTPAAVAGVAGANGAPGGTPAAPAGLLPGGQPVMPSQVLVKFNEQFPGLLGGLTGLVGNLHVQAASVARTQAEIIDGAKEGVIQSFFDRTQGPNGSGQVTEAEIPGLRKLLMRCDHGAVRRFSDTTLRNTSNARRAAGSGTELEETIADMERSRTSLRKFGHKAPQRPVDSTGSNGMTAERRARILKGAGVVEKK